MNAPMYAPPVPAPPHDPSSLLLNFRAGWRSEMPLVSLDGLDIDTVEGSLMLARLAGARRRFEEPSGSFGGLRLPSNVAMGPDGSLYLLNRKSISLMRFDACSCSFEKIPCLGGEGGGARQLRNPGGIAICAGNLFICDTGREANENHRVSVFSLKGFALREHLRPPAGKGPWRPTAIAFDALGRAWVADADGWLHRFAPSGQWETRLQGVLEAVHIAIDRCDRIYVGALSPPQLRVFDRDGKPQPVPPGPDKVALAFPQLPFTVDPEENLDLSPCGLFGLDGLPLDKLPPKPSKIFLERGHYRSDALDSKTAQCQWHRVILDVEVPAGSSVQVLTFTADEIYTVDQLDDIAQWQTGAIARDCGPGQWDCLVRSGPGRYLWLALEFRGNGTATPRVKAVQFEFPRISLRRFLPAVFGEEPSSADFTDRFLALFDTPMRELEREIDSGARLYDPLSAPSTQSPQAGPDFLSWLASWIGLGFDRQWDEATRRRFLKRAGALFDRRGTPAGLREQLLIALGFDRLAPCAVCVSAPGRCAPAPLNCSPQPQAPAWTPPPLILEHFRLRRWLRVGAGRLGEQAVLWGQRIVNRTQLGAGAQAGITQLIKTPDPARDPFLYHANQFSVFVPARWGASDKARKGLENLLRAESPAHARHTVHYVGPRFRIGVQSMLGFDAAIAALPQGVVLGATPIGPASVLTSPPHLAGGPAIALDREGRVGTTTVLS